MANRNIWLDGIMGVVVGDALGSPAQFRWREELRQHPITEMVYCDNFRMPAGSWTDDSSLTLATLASLVECDEYNLKDIADKFVAWLHKGEYTPFGSAYDIGYGCESGIDRYARSGDPTTSGGNDERNNGNGSLMRIMPMCLYLYERQKKVCTSENEAIYMIHEVSGITHRHLRAQMACGLYYFCAKHIINDKDSKSLKQCLQEGIDEGLAYYGQDLRNLTEMAHFGRLYNLDELKKAEEDKVLTTGYVVDTIVASVWNLITTSSYEECLLKVVNLGDDADTVGAVAGGLAGLYYGYEAIPGNWLQKIKKREWIEGMCEHFADCSDIDVKVVDMHSHMMPYVDDGSRDMSITKRMITLAYNEGCRHLFLTPHSYCLERAEVGVEELRDKITKWIAEEGMNLMIHQGAEIYVDPDDAIDKFDVQMIINKIKNGTYPTLNGTDYVLIEFYLGGFLLEDVKPAVQTIIDTGYKPVIAHAERYGVAFEDLLELKKMGCLFQMNLCDVFYKYENENSMTTYMLLKERMFDFVGTDAHGIDRRPPEMKKYIDFLYRNYDKDYVDAILWKNASECFGFEM